MPRKKKRPIDLTTEEAMKKLFPKKVRETLKEEAAKPPVKPPKRSE